MPRKITINSLIQLVKKWAGGVQVAPEDQAFCFEPTGEASPYVETVKSLIVYNGPQSEAFLNAGKGEGLLRGLLPEGDYLKILNQLQQKEAQAEMDEKAAEEKRKADAKAEPTRRLEEEQAEHLREQARIAQREVKRAQRRATQERQATLMKLEQAKKARAKQEKEAEAMRKEQEAIEAYRKAQRQPEEASVTEEGAAQAMYSAVKKSLSDFFGDAMNELGCDLEEYVGFAYLALLLIFRNTINRDDGGDVEAVLRKEQVGVEKIEASFRALFVNGARNCAIFIDTHPNEAFVVLCAMRQLLVKHCVAKKDFFAVSGNNISLFYEDFDEFMLANLGDKVCPIAVKKLTKSLPGFRNKCVRRYAGSQMSEIEKAALEKGRSPSACVTFRT